MTAKYVVAIADNAGETETELVFRAGDVIKVLCEDTGSEGWWEGEIDGRAGFFPESFVVPTDAPQQQQKPSSAAMRGGGAAAGGGKWRAKVLFDYVPDNREDLPVHAGDVVTCMDLPASPEWVDAELNGRRGYVPASYVQRVEDSAAAAAKPKPPTASAAKAAPKPNPRPKAAAVAAPPPPSPSTPAPAPTAAAAAAAAEVLYRINGDMQWTTGAGEEPVCVVLTVGEKRAKKFSGLKKFTVYTITCSDGCVVERRYKHFDWLHQRLRDKFPLLALPTPPEKQLSGRFDDQFLETRRRQLERYLNACTHHPVIASSTTLRFFLRDTREAAEWKAGKRAAEKDARETGGDKMLRLVGVEGLSVATSEPAVERASRFHKHAAAAERAMNALHETDVALTAKRATVMPELEKIADRWNALAAEACWIPDCASCGQLAKTYGEFASVYIAEREAIRPEAHTPYVADITRHFGCLNSTFQDLCKHAESTENDLEKKKKVADERAAAVAAAAPAAAAAMDQPVMLPGQARSTVLAEMHVFHRRRLEDMREALLAEAQAQRDMHHKLSEMWSAIATSLEQQLKQKS